MNMASKYFRLLKILIVGMALVLPFSSAFALTPVTPEDFLQVHLSYDRTVPKVEMLNVVQVSQNPVYAHIQTVGDYTLSLQAKGKTISQNSFSLPTGEMEVLSRDQNGMSGENIPVPEKSTIYVYLPLNDSYDQADLSISLSQGGKELWNKSLAETHFRSQSVVKNQVQVQEDPSLTAQVDKPLDKIWYIIGGIALVVLLGLVIALLIWRKRKSTINPPPPLSPPSV